MAESMGRMNTEPLSPDELLSTTRSVRKRLDLQRPVPIELVRECLRIAVQAPTGSNRQDWHWIVVTDAAARAQIAAYYRRSFERYYRSSPAPENLYPDDPARAGVQRRVAASAVYLAERMGEVPVLVIAGIKLGSGRLPEGNQAGLWGSLLPAVWSYMLAARARGLGTVLDLPAPGLRARGGRVARHSRRRPPGRAHPHRLLHRRHLPARAARAARRGHPPRPLVSRAG